MNHGYPVTFTAPFVITKRKRALDKVSQFLSQIPSFLGPPSRPSLSAHASRTPTPLPVPLPLTISQPVAHTVEEAEVIKAVLSTVPAPAPPIQPPSHHPKPSVMVLSDKVHVTKVVTPTTAVEPVPVTLTAAAEPVVQNIFDTTYLDTLTTIDARLLVIKDWQAVFHVRAFCIL